MAPGRLVGRLLAPFVVVALLTACQAANPNGGAGPAPAPGGQQPIAEPTATPTSVPPEPAATEAAPTPAEVATPTAADTPKIGRASWWERV